MREFDRKCSAITQLGEDKPSHNKERRWFPRDPRVQPVCTGEPTCSGLYSSLPTQYHQGSPVFFEDQKTGCYCRTKVGDEDNGDKEDFRSVLAYPNNWTNRLSRGTLYRILSASAVTDPCSGDQGETLSNTTEMFAAAHNYSNDTRMNGRLHMLNLRIRCSLWSSRPYFLNITT